MKDGPKNFRELLARGGLIVAPSVYDGYSARLVEKAGFEMAATTGAGISNSLLGIDDIGVMGLSENVDHCRMLARTLSIPLTADADTGYGNALNAQAAARAFERAGVAAFHLEDQTFPKKCGHYDDKGVVPAAEMVQKLKAVRDALHDGNEPAWMAATTRPNLFLHEEWAIAISGDAVATAVQRATFKTGPRYHLERTITIKGAPVIEIYKRD